MEPSVSGFADTIEAAILDHFFGKAAWAQPTDIFVALSTADPTDAGTGIAEPVGNGYARIDTAPTDWNAATGTAPVATTNATTLTFAQASGAWGDITHFALFDALTAGTFLGSGLVNAGTPVTVASGDTPEFAAGSLAMKLGDPGDVY